MRSLTNDDIRTNRELWATELEQTEILQGTRSLRYTDREGNIRQCCLGIACNIFMPDWKEVPIVDWDRTNHFEVAGCNAIPPGEVLMALGLNDNGGVGEVNYNHDSVWSFVELNDSKSYTFKQIAAVVRDLNARENGEQE